ncbi:MAG: NAD(P)H-binding protein [Verrucomicrobiae bacterium]|nr:NAD(P)H-binding protein [Verrucomicrobiae bacterium]
MATPPPTSRVLVTGGTGFVGRHVVARLRASGFAVRVLARDPSRVAATPGLAGAELVAGDASDGIPDACMRDVAAVVHLVGIIAERGQNTFERAHVRATANAVAAARSAGVGRFIHLTALGTRPNARSAYHRTKWLAEDAVRASGLDWTILRPSLILGRGCGFVGEFASMMRGRRLVLQGGVVPCFGDGGTLFQPISVGDVAHCVARAIANPEAVGQAIALCGNERVSLKDMLLGIARGLGRNPTWISDSPALYPFLVPWAMLTRPKPLVVAIPFSIARALGWALGHLPDPPFTLDQAIMLEEDNTADPEPAKRLFGFEPVPFPEMLADSL